ncbi:hypothetical protein [Paraburkholderia sp. BCC1886]|uniref:glycine-rich domain-containing protein n=1 Tax=Paraburkholderia sp. BCC1886 TaxID=2562670 RepID=UPI001183A751|nr:hypothetical protein [Paraburkholderia sp. BCC1886]
MGMSVQGALARLVDLFGPQASWDPTKLYGNLMVSPAGNILVGATTDAGNGKFQVTGSSFFSQRPMFGLGVPWDSLNLPSVNGRLIKITPVAASEVFTFQALTTQYISLIQGGGGGGGGVVATSSSSVAASGNGGAGALAIDLRSVTGGSTIQITVGAAGTAGAVGDTGGTGGTSSVGSASATGGTGGGGGPGASSGGTNIGTAVGGNATGGALLNIPGNSAIPNNYSEANFAQFSVAANSMFGAGAQSVLNGNGAPGRGYGSGGGGVISGGSQPGYTGGVAAPGIVLMIELS